MRNFGVTTRLVIMFVFLSVLPLVGALILLHDRGAADAEVFLACMAALSIMMLGPLAEGAAQWLVLRDVRDINRACLDVRRGNYLAPFDLPVQREEENDIIQLKRNMQWMVHVMASREGALLCQLDETARGRDVYRQLSLEDALTGVATRRHFEERASALLSREGLQLALIMIDLDGFKGVNDRHGHLAGDGVLRGLGRLLRASVRKEGDLPFRFGGDEFGVLCSGVGPEEARMLAERIRCRHAAEHNGTTLSVGIAWCTAGGATPQVALQSLQARADAALYRGKANGGNCVMLGLETGLDVAKVALAASLESTGS